MLSTHRLSDKSHQVTRPALFQTAIFLPCLQQLIITWRRLHLLEQILSPLDKSRAVDKIVRWDKLSAAKTVSLWVEGACQLLILPMMRCITALNLHTNSIWKHIKRIINKSNRLHCFLSSNSNRRQAHALQGQISSKINKTQQRLNSSSNPNHHLAAIKMWLLRNHETPKGETAGSLFISRWEYPPITLKLLRCLLGN